MTGNALGVKFNSQVQNRIYWRRIAVSPTQRIPMMALLRWFMFNT